MLRFIILVTVTAVIARPDKCEYSSAPGWWTPSDFSSFLQEIIDVANEEECMTACNALIGCEVVTWQYANPDHPCLAFSGGDGEASGSNDDAMTYVKESCDF